MSIRSIHPIFHATILSMIIACGAINAKEALDKNQKVSLSSQAEKQKNTIQEQQTLRHSSDEDAAVTNQRQQLTLSQCQQQKQQGLLSRSDSQYCQSLGLSLNE